MGRSRYKVYEPTYPHFVTCTVLHWIPLFTRQESVQIIIDSLKFLQQKDNLKLYAYVILENHLHMVVQSDDIDKSIKSFKQYTAKALLELLKKENVKMILDQLQFYKKAHKNPVRRGYVDEEIHWRYSSARDYVGENGLFSFHIS